MLGQFGKIRLACAGLIALAVAGCSAPMPDANAAVQSSDDAYFILGLQPRNMMLQIDQVEIKNDAITRFVNSLPLHEYGQTQGDFVVVKEKGDTQLAIQSIAIMAGHSIFGVLYRPCKGTLTFRAPAGKVVYITNIDYISSGAGHIVPAYHQDFQGAQDFLTLHYPLLAGKLEQGRFDVVQYPYGTCR
jgi:hypothetical protein